MEDNPAKIDRRQLLHKLALTTAAAITTGSISQSLEAFAAKVAEKGEVFPPTTVNHLALGASDYAKSRDWYADLLGMRVVWDDGKNCALEFGNETSPNGIYIRQLAKASEKPGVGHIAFGIPNFMAQKAAMKGEMERRGLKNIRADGEVGWIANDPSGYMLNTWVHEKDPAMYPGAARPCEVADSATCKAGLEAGLKNLGAIPKPSGEGFTALYFSYIVLNVPAADLVKEREFYAGMYGMKVLYDREEGPNPEIFLKFGQNALCLRKTVDPEDKPYCNCYGFVIENYDQSRVKSELEHRGLKPERDSKLGWAFNDPDGMRIEIAAPGLPEQIAKDCRRVNTDCSEGPKQ